MMTKLGAQNLIAKGKLPEAIAALLTLLNDYLSIHTEDTFTLDLRNALISNAGKLAELSQSKIKGIVHREDESLIFSRVNVSVLDIMDQLPVSVWAGSTASKTITEQLKASKLLRDFVQKYGDDHPTNAFVELHESVVQTFGAYDDWSLLRLLEEMAEENKARQEAISVHIPEAAKAFVANHHGDWKPAQWLKFKDEIFAEYGEVMSVRELAGYLEETKMRFKEMLKDFVFIEGGEFMMGAPDGDPDADEWEKPQHQVQVSDFYMCKYTVTLGQFEEFISETGYQTDADKDGGSYTYPIWEKKSGVNWRCDVKGDIQKNVQHPVIHVSWNDSIAFCSFWNAKYGFSPAYDAKGTLLDSSGKATTMLMQVHGFRLPSEAEWEYAARGGQLSQGYTYAGSNNLDEVAWYAGNSGDHTRPVGLKKPNELYLYDMSGNVWERCQDKWHDDYQGAPTDGSAWEGNKGSYRVYRGGSWYDYAVDCRVVDRFNDDPVNRYYYLGFRLVFVPQFGG